MVLRTAKKGSHKGQQFYGCSRFPRCKGVRNIESSVKPGHTTSGTAFATPRTKSNDDTPLTEKQKKELLRLRDRLLNLSSSNRSIRLNRLDKKSTFDLSRLNIFSPSCANEIVSECLNQAKQIPVLPAKTTDNELEWNSLSESLNHLHRNITEIQKEKGLYDLYIGFPFVTGNPAGSETIIQAPVFLLPVKLEKIVPKRGTPTWHLEPSQDTRVLFNRTLFYSLAKLSNFTINSEIFESEVMPDLYGQEHFITWTQKLLAEYGFVTSVHPDALDQSFDPVNEFTIKDLKIEDFEGLQLRQHAVLGHFPQSSSSIQKDYEALLTMKQEEIDGILSFLSDEYLDLDQEFNGASVGNFDFSNSEATESSTIDQRPERDNFLILPSDSSQDRILLELAKPDTDGLVVWGPPGTGKSQTIVNIISDCISRGKSVLLVSQKRAALDVVFERLGTKGMDRFAALVHDTKNDRKDLYHKISSACQSVDAPKVRSIDPSAEIDRITTTLKDVNRALTDNKFGVPFGTIEQTLAKYRGPLLNGLPSIWMTISVNQLEEYSQALDSVQSLTLPVLNDRVQSIRKSFEAIPFEQQRSSVNTVRRILNSNSLLTAVKIIARDSNVLCDLPDTQDYKEFDSNLNSLNQQKEFSRFFRVSYWKLASKVRRTRRSAKDVAIQAAKDVRLAFDPFFNCKSVQDDLNFEKRTQSAIQFVSDLLALIDRYFDSFKAYDTYRKKLDRPVLEIEQDIRRLGQTDSSISLGAILKHSVFASWEQELESIHPVVAMIRSGHVDQLRARLGQLLDQKTDYCVDVMRDRLLGSLASPSGRDFARSISHEVQKKRNIPTIRKLNEKFLGTSNFKSLFPVWLASPETVSDIFPLVPDLFDVVIFDEASQCTVECGIPAAFRGKQVVVAGDDKQLQPNRLFEVSLDEYDEESVATSEPSFLELARKTLKYKAAMLEWHYRSKFQELVTFSNAAFYQGKMKIAPNVIPFIKGNKPAITWHRVTGYWTSRTNEQEASRVVELVSQFMLNRPDKTIGIITFNSDQKDLILNMIEAKCANDPDFAALYLQDQAKPLDEQLFVKNIENVQGDERELIIFSVAYAPSEPGGRVHQNFGLLNKPGGENRLNVAVTRAIEAIHVVCSIDPETDLNTSMSAHPGPKFFHQYLKFAKAVAHEDFDRVGKILSDLNPNLNVREQSVHFDSPFEEDVFNELKSRGFDVHTQVGQSGFRIDLAVVDPNNPSRYKLGIECDGAQYHSGISIRERDVFRQRFLEGRGWTICRIWSPSWRTNREAIIRDIIAKIEKK